MLLLTIIYLAFISLGLPDAVLGAAWPTISKSINAPLEYAGAISMVVNAGTVISSLLSARIIHRFGTGKVVSFSVLMTALALIGFAKGDYLWVMMLMAVPLGLGAGAVDAALNNFAAVHYQSKHMNYLHSFWGVGATAGPIVMASFLLSAEGWRDGYLLLAAVQCALVAVLFFTLPLWKSVLTTNHAEGESSAQPSFVSNRDALKIPGVKFQLLVFWSYCSLEAGTGLWAASYLTVIHGVAVADAAFWTAVYFLGITAGRFFCGMIADHFDEERMVLVGVLMMALGVVGLMLPLPLIVNQLSLLLIGLGCAPVYPNTIHLTPQRFGKEASQTIIGLSMASAYVGTTLVPPVIGLVVGAVTFTSFPVMLLLLSAVMLAMVLRLQSIQRIDLQAQTS